MNAPLAQLLYGLDAGHLVAYDAHVKIHRYVMPSLEAMTAAAREAGIDLRVCSGHRSFREQLSIWNQKARGRRVLLDSQGKRLDPDKLDTDQMIEAILRWSALPGASRHHWGTDLDVWDAAAVPAKYRLKLTTEESETRFAALHAWLDANMHEFGFFRPYATDLGGVAPEAWHLSYAPLSRDFLRELSVDSLRELLEGADMRLKDRVLERLPELFDRFALRVAAA